MSDGALAQIDIARVAIAKAKSVEEVVEMRNQAAAMQHYLDKRGGTLKVAIDASEIKLRCERRLGEMLREMPRNKGGRPKDETCSTMEQVLKLEELGVDRKDSHRWQQIATLPVGEFEGYIDECRSEERDASTAGALLLAKTLKAKSRKAESQAPHERGCTLADLDSLVASGKKFGTIYADPPWNYGNQATRASTDNHYSTLTVDDICALPVADLAADKAHLHLWTTNGFLREAFDVIEAWGFTYKSCFVWVKSQLGIGNYWRVSHEFMLLGVRGEKATFQVKDKRSWIEAPRSKHSAKPESIRLMIEEVSPAPRLELFGRGTVEGWTVWGNQVERNLLAVVNE